MQNEKVQKMIRVPCGGNCNGFLVPLSRVVVSAHGVDFCNVYDKWKCTVCGRMVK